MNILESENRFMVEAKICSCSNNKKSVSYQWIASSYNLCLENREIIFAQIQACDRLLKYTKGEEEILALKREIVELHLTLVANNISKINIDYCTSVGCNKKAIICCTLCSDYRCYEHLQGHSQ